MLNGHKIQISYIKKLEAWLIGVKNCTTILRDKNDLSSIFTYKYDNNYKGAFNPTKTK